MTKQINAEFKSQDDASSFMNALASTYNNTDYEIIREGHVVEHKELKHDGTASVRDSKKYLIVLEIRDDSIDSIRELIQDFAGQFNEGTIY